MEVLYLGSLMLKFDSNKNNSFKNYVEFKEKIDTFEGNSIALVK